MVTNKTLPLWPLPLIVVGVLGILNPVAIFATAILAIVPVIAQIFKRPSQAYGVGAPLTLFVVSAFTGLWAAYDPALSLPMVLTILGSVLWFFSIVYIDSEVAKTVIKEIVIMASLIALYFVTQYAHIGYESETGIMASIARTPSSIIPDLAFFAPHPNAVAGLLGSTIFLSAALALQPTKMTNRLIWGAITILMTYALLVTGSRGMWMGLVVAVAIWAILYLPEWIQRLIGLGIGLAVGLLIGVLFIVQFAPEASLKGIPILGSLIQTAASRLTLYQNGLNLFWDYPFTGIGPGDTFAMIYSRFQLLINVPYLEYAHNLFLAVALGQGILGLIALFWLLVSLYLFVFRVEQTIDNSNSSLLFRAVWLSVTAIFFHGFTDAVQFSEARWTTPILFALLGLTVTTGRMLLSRPAPSDNTVLLQVAPKLSWALLTALIIVGVAIAAIWRPLVGAGYTNLGAIHQAKADLSPYLTDRDREITRALAKTCFERALEVNPQSRVAHRRLGIIALDDNAYEEAIAHLEQAYSQEPDNQATLKALGYAYLWTGQTDTAHGLFTQVTFQARLIQELEYWQWQWRQRNQEVLSGQATEMFERLAGR